MQRCRAMKLVKNPTLSIDLCECGQIHLHLGKATFHLSETELETVAESAVCALQRINMPVPMWEQFSAG